jgi:sporulation integral membrane protein YtvI
MQNENRNIYLKIIISLIIYAVVILCLIYLLPKVLIFFLPFIVGWIIALIANPLVKFLEKRVKIVRKHSSAIIVIAVIAGVIFAIYGIIQFLIGQTSSLINDLPNIVVLINETLDQVGENLSGIFGILPLDLQASIDQVAGHFKEAINSFIGSERVSEATISFARSIGEYILGILIVFISAYFFIKDREIIIDKTKAIIPEAILEKYNMVVHYFKHAVSGYFKAQIKIMFIIIIFMFAGFQFIGTNYSLLIAIITGLIDLLPVFGTGFILWPWALVEFILGNYFDAVFLMALYTVCLLVKNVLQPKMVGDSVGLTPLVTLLFLYIGYKLGGIIGMIVAIPIGIVIVNLYRIGMFDNIIRGFKILIQDLNKYRKF